MATPTPPSAATRPWYPAASPSVAPTTTGMSTKKPSRNSDTRALMATAVSAIG